MQVQLPLAQEGTSATATLFQAPSVTAGTPPSMNWRCFDGSCQEPV